MTASMLLDASLIHYHFGINGTDITNKVSKGSVSWYKRTQISNGNY